MFPDHELPSVTSVHNSVSVFDRAAPSNLNTVSDDEQSFTVNGEPFDPALEARQRLGKDDGEI